MKRLISIAIVPLLFPGLSFAAVARDTSIAPVTVASGDLTQSYTNAGNLLTVTTYEENTDAISSVTFNGAAMTFFNKNHACYSAGGTDHTMSVYYLLNPSVTTANIVVTRSSGTGHMEMAAASYSGAGAPNVFSGFISGTPGTCGTGATLLSGSITVSTSGSWVGGFARFDNGGTVSGTGVLTKLNQGAAGETLIEANFDSNTNVSTGAQSVGASGANAGSIWTFVTFTIPPATGNTFKFWQFLPW